MSLRLANASRALLPFACALLFAGCPIVFRRTYTQAEVQSLVSSGFPREARRSILFVRLANPVVSFVEGGRIAMQIDLEAGALAPLWRGHAAVEGSLEYRASDGGSYLHDPVVRDLALDRVPQEWIARARAISQTALTIALAQAPLYVLDVESRGRERAHLRRVWIEDDRLVVELQL